MLEKKIDARTALKAFHQIQQNGKKNHEGYYYQGLTSVTSYDGYTLIIKNDVVSLYLFFHNTFKVDYQQRWHLQEFIDALNKIVPK